jgi:hypothetical protein
MLTIAKEEKVLAVGVCQSSNLYRLDIQSTRRPEPAAVSSVAQLAKTETHSMSVWHQRLGHVCVSTIKKMDLRWMKNWHL